MTYELIIGDRTFSSWSYRGWLMLEKFTLPFKTTIVGLYAGTMAQEIAHLAPSRTVPILLTPERHVLTDSIAMAETLAERHPDHGFWPSDPGARALARSLVAEMHSSFMPLWDACPNMVCCTWDGFEPSEAVKKDVARIEELWALARARYGQDGPWLFGEYSLADVFYAPIAFRFTTYKLAVSPESQFYVDLHLKDPALRKWKVDADQEVYDPFPYDLGLARSEWPSFPD